MVGMKNGYTLYVATWDKGATSFSHVTYWYTTTTNIIAPTATICMGSLSSKWWVLNQMSNGQVGLFGASIGGSLSSAYYFNTPSTVVHMDMVINNGDNLHIFF